MEGAANGLLCLRLGGEVLQGDLHLRLGGEVVEGEFLQVRGGPPGKVRRFLWRRS